MSKKFVYVDSNGDYTDAVGYETGDFIAASTGVADADKPIKTDASGLIDGTFVNQSAIDHGNLSGLSDDDHAQYLLATGARDLTGIIKYSSNLSFSDEKSLVSKKYVDDMINGEEWQDSCIDILSDPPVAPNLGDRYLVGPVATGDFSGQEDKIAEYNGTAWIFYTPSIGWKVSIDDETDGVYLYTGSAWTKKNYESTTASLGCKKIGVDIQADLATAKGLKLIGNQIAVEPGDFVGEGVIDDGTDKIAIDWSTAFNDSKAVKASDLNSTSVGKGASIIGIADANGIFTASNVEGALEELYGFIADAGTLYNVGVGGVTKGDLVAITSNNTVVRLNIATTAHRAAVGIALETKSAGQTVKVLANDTICTNTLTGATAGQQYFWNGTAHVSTPPAGGGAYVFRTGFAKNATDLHVEVEFIKKNS